MTDTLQPPRAAQRPHRSVHHNRTLDDPWAWLRDPGYPEVTDRDVLDYLTAENDYFQAHMAARKSQVDALFAEMKGRIKEEDGSVPQKDGAYVYWSTFEAGEQYRRHWRRKVGAAEDGSADELIVDEPALAAGKDYFRLGGVAISNDDRLLAYAIDDNGSERYTVRIRNLETGEMLPDVIPDVLSALVWTHDDRALVYAPANAQWRTDRAMLHRLGSDVAQDVMLYHEADEGFRVSVGLTCAENWIVIATGDHVTSEVRLVPAGDPTAAPILVSARVPEREYDVDEHEGWLYIRANDTHPNFRLARARIETPDQWEEVLPASDAFYLTDFSLFKRFYVTEGRENGLDQVEIRDYATNTPKRLDFPEASYVAGLDDNPEYDVDTLRLSYESMVTPETIFDYRLADGHRETLKVREIPSGFDPALYATQRLTITARDGTPIPVSVLHRRDHPLDGSRPLYLYGYGAYGIAIEPGFGTTRLSLVDRGFAFAIAHIRGGDDLGQQWYKDGKLEKRTNTFNDFVDVAKGLIALGYTSAGKIATSGGSAGGELMGAIVNSDPDLWGAVVAHVPFVDVLNTMLDETLPLTPGEWPEWGNPIEDAAAYDLIASYSPYDNVKAQAYPPMLVTAGLNDPRVTYWEPAKWVAKLRELKTDDNVLLLKTNMEAGHGGKSGRWESLRETAEEFAFILWQLGMEEAGQGAGDHGGGHG
ncbi:oligopeptidase B [Sphingobium sp. B1D7B]|uniref:S9 family peptidase n=1 Tax=unclassified Sphingobium TaxID=2611147 RepID=UPI0022243B34|nr:MULTISPECIES: S9 family peptidase [unclassified Sphingobium]MCW2392887.1 oligopeptidase B [Sphingobium sp. B11D3A]MCW2404689.1 oligopeptidase B [Sphingobium sp. B1D7B]